MFGDLFGDLQKRTGRYLLQRYLGQFLDGKLSLQQLEINLLNGRGTVNDVSLSCKVRCLIIFYSYILVDSWYWSDSILTLKLSRSKKTNQDVERQKHMMDVCIFPQLWNQLSNHLKSAATTSTNQPPKPALKCERVFFVLFSQFSFQFTVLLV